MQAQNKQLRNIAKNLLDNEYLQNYIHPILNELLTYQIELEVQNLNLIESEEKLNLFDNNLNDLYNYAPVPYFTINSKGLICNVNLAGIELLEIKKTELINRVLARYVAPESQGNYINFLKNVFKTGDSICQLKMLKRPGILFDARLESRLIKCDINDSEKILIIIYDINNISIMNVNSPQICSDIQNKILNNISLIMAHEINHPLGVIGNYIHGCLRRLQNDTFQKSDLMQILQKAADQLERASDIIYKMKNFLYYNKLEFSECCIETLINETKNHPIYECARIS